MTKKSALELAISVLSADAANDDAVTVLNNMVTQLAARNKPASDATKAKRREATATARAELVAKVAPVLRKYLTADRTAKELWADAASELPAGFTWQQVQNILLRELAPEVIKTEAKGKANTYRLRPVA